MPGFPVLHSLPVKVKVTQSYPTLWDPMDYTVLETLQAGILEWVAFPFSRDKKFSVTYDEIIEIIYCK